MKTLGGVCCLAIVAASLAACGKKNDEAAVTSATSVAATSSSVPECDAYIDRVNKCVEKLGANSPMAANYKQQMDATKATWAEMRDKSVLANVCKQANDAFNQSAQLMKCE